MIILLNGYSNHDKMKGDINMSNSNEFLDTLHEKQAKDEQNRKRQGTETQRKKPNKTHK